MCPLHHPTSDIVTACHAYPPFPSGHRLSHRIWTSPKTGTGGKWWDASPRAGLTIWGPHTKVRRRPFSHSRSQDFSQDFLYECTFLPQKSWRTFFSRRVVVCSVFWTYVQTSKQHAKIWQLIGGPSHGTTGTMVNPALRPPIHPVAKPLHKISLVAQPYWCNIEPIFNQYGTLRIYWPRYNDCILT